MALDARLLQVLADPEDKGPLYYVQEDNLLFNPRLGRAYDIRDDIPVLLIDESRQVEADMADRINKQIASGTLTPTF
jgi:uncharacterized protein YbaR (Trm112 family)